MGTVSELLLSSIPGLIVAIVGTFVSFGFALSRFHSEKWWERKADAYSRIVEELYHVKNSLDTYISFFEQGREVPNQKRTELQERSTEAYKEIYKAESIGAFIISDEVAAALSEMRREERTLHTEDTLYELIHARSSIVTKCLLRIRELAKEELSYR